MKMNKSQICLGSVLFLVLYSCISLAHASDGNETHDEKVKQSIRHQRTKHFESKGNGGDDTNAINCRYESEISTAPPKGRVVLSFDDGPDPLQTKYILGILAKYKIPATFFLVGHRVQAHPELLELIRSSTTHLVGNHSWTHPNFHDLSVDDQLTEINKTYKVLPTDDRVRLLRYPYGNSTCEGNNFARELGYKLVGWHVDTCDWAFDSNGSVSAKEAQICGVLPQNVNNFVEHVVSTVRAHNGGILLMHEIHHNTLQQLESIILELKRNGFGFTNLDDPGYSGSLR